MARTEVESPKVKVSKPEATDIYRVHYLRTYDQKTGEAGEYEIQIIMKLFDVEGSAVAWKGSNTYPVGTRSLTQLTDAQIIKLAEDELVEMGFGEVV